MPPLPADTAWLAYVERTIERLEQQGGLFAALALVGWRKHRETVLESLRYWG